MKKFITSIFVFTFIFIGQLDAQDIKAVPKEYLKPLRLEGLQKFKFENDVHEQPRKRNVDREMWYVLSDRIDNPSYEYNDLSSPVKKQLVFGELLYVIDDKEGWLHLMKGIPGDFEFGSHGEDYGWVPKSHVLLWRRSLINPVTRIHYKGFILNKADKFDHTELEKAVVYAGPKKADKEIGYLPLHEFYFIYKVEYDENDQPYRYLLGDGSVLSSRALSSLKGWVDARKLEDWNTRLALECNFENQAFEERKSNRNYEVKAYSKATDAIGVYRGTDLENVRSKIMWDGDPVKRNLEDLGKTDSKRFPGDVIRFPILKNESEYFRSGVIASLPAQQAAVDGEKNEDVEGIQNSIKSTLANRTKDLNVFFLIEGSSSVMAEYINTIKETMNWLEVNKLGFENIKFGAGIYKDHYEESNNDIYKQIELTYSINEVNTFLDNTYWGSIGDNDDYVCMNYALNRSMKFAGFNEDDTNVIVQIGNYADKSTDASRRQESMDYMIKKSELRKSISKYEIHWVIAQLENKSESASVKYNEHIRKLMNDFSKDIYSEYSKLIEDNFGGKVPFPVVPELADGNLIATRDFITKNSFLRADVNSKLTNTELSGFIKESVTNVSQYVNDSSEQELGDVEITPGASGVWSPEIIPILRRAISRSASQKLEPEEIQMILKKITSYSFYKAVYFPKKIANASNGPFSYVLYMPQEDLDSYVNELNKLITSYDGPKDKRREQVQKVMESLARQFTADQLPIGQLLKLEMEDVRYMMAGIEKEGYDIESDLGIQCKIGDIDNPNKCSEEDLSSFILSLEEQANTLNQILKDKPPYEFKYETESNTYYWIPVSIMF